LQRSDLPESLRRVPELMRGFSAPWCVAGGWALDLFLGRVTRAHDDVELAIFRDDQLLLRRHLRGWAFDTVADGRLVPWSSDERLVLPVHEIHARARGEHGFTIEFLLNERTAENWVFRRDPRVTRPIDRAILASDQGHPILSPEIVLLYKSKSPRPKDHADFRSARDGLNPEQRSWLWHALRMVHPAHPWRDQL
jgi:hypothetical protein